MIWVVTCGGGGWVYLRERERERWNNDKSIKILGYKLQCFKKADVGYFEEKYVNLQLFLLYICWCECSYRISFGKAIVEIL